MTFSNVTLLAWEDSPFDSESADVCIGIGDIRLSCEARFFYAPEVGVGGVYPVELVFEVFWHEPRIGARRPDDNARPSVLFKDDVYRIIGSIVNVDPEQHEMTVDCQCGFQFAMDLVEGFQPGDQVEAEGWFLLHFAPVGQASTTRKE